MASPSEIQRSFVRQLILRRDDVPSFERYPFSIPAVRHLDTLDLDPKITFIIGENGSGKSTLIEALAVKAGFNAEGGSQNFRFATEATHSDLHEYVRIVRGTRRPQDGFFFRAETFYNVATEVDRLGVSGYGPRSLHDQSHGEAFLTLAATRLRGNGLYILDEPESALSPARQLGLLRVFHLLTERRSSQLVVATHSPIVLAYPGATIYHLDASGIRTVAYEETEHYEVTKSFLCQRESFLKHLFEEDT